MEDQLEGLYTTFKQKQEELVFLDNDFDKVFINFVRIEVVALGSAHYFPQY